MLVKKGRCPACKKLMEVPTTYRLWEKYRQDFRLLMAENIILMRKQEKHSMALLKLIMDILTISRKMENI